MAVKVNNVFFRVQFVGIKIYWTLLWLLSFSEIGLGYIYAKGFKTVDWTNVLCIS